MDRLNQFKKKRFEFGSIEARITRACEVEKRRKQQRAKDIARNRFATIVDEKLSEAILLPEELQSQNAQVNNRVKQLLKWKADKEMKKKVDAQSKKPPFVVGIPHHKPWSATTDNFTTLDCQHHKKNKTHLIVPTRITRATAKRLAEKEKIAKSDTLLKCKPETTKKKRKKRSEEPIMTFPSIEHHVFHAPKGIAPVRMLDIQNFSTDKKPQTSTTNIIKVFNDNNIKNEATFNVNLIKNVNNMNKNQSEIILENNSLRDKDTNVLFQSLVPAALSPFVTTKRGKSNIRDEQRERLGLNSPRNAVPTKDNITDILNASANESPKTAQYYKYLLNQETDRLHNLCEKWKKIQESSETTDDGQYIINQAIGQTILLINKKFKRFDGLVSDCITGNKELLVTCRDLQGFWDMMSIEIKDCLSRFEKLEILKTNSWIEEKLDIKKVGKLKKQPIIKNKITGKSNMRAFIEASRKQKMNDQKIKLELDHQIMFSKSPCYHTRASTGKQNPLKTEPKLDNSISYITSEQTRGKGILKHNEIEKSYDQFDKSAVKVNFNEVINYDKISPNRIVERNENPTFPNIVKTRNFNKNIGINSDILKKTNSYSNSEASSELIAQDNDNMKSFSKRGITKKRKSLLICDNTISSSRILRSHSQFDHNNAANNALDKIDNLKEKNRQLISSPSNKLKIKLNRESIKENDYILTPHQRRSTRKSTKLNYSGECTACTPVRKIKSVELNC
ncbi:uncharacterized protein mars [Chelonus insularis]|uniref:uncharacterized protein mars n=1 Tax=Chelonus insularis TaxID=460826 RepID=UPI00158E1D95|nr:uncharacterized protein LOC118067132 [Chelonus insularis]